MLLCVYFHQVHVWLAFLAEEGDVVELAFLTHWVGNFRPGELLVVWKLVVAEVAHEMLGCQVS